MMLRLSYHDSIRVQSLSDYLVSINLYCIFQSLSDYLGSKQFLMGDQPSVVDCALFGTILQIQHAVREDCVYR